MTTNTWDSNYAGPVLDVTGLALAGDHTYEIGSGVFSGINEEGTWAITVSYTPVVVPNSTDIEHPADPFWHNDIADNASPLSIKNYLMQASGSIGFLGGRSGGNSGILNFLTPILASQANK